VVFFSFFCHLFCGLRLGWVLKAKSYQIQFQLRGHFIYPIALSGLKEDLVWTHDWSLPFQFQADFENWIQAYNSDFPHQSLGYKTPQQTMVSFLNRKSRKEVLNNNNLSLIFN
jgi:hypothetical protein